MQLQVRLFASIRDAVGRREMVMEMPEGATPEEVWGALVAEHPSLAARRQSLAAAVNREYVPFDHPLRPGDEIVFIPPISGG